MARTAAKKKGKRKKFKPARKRKKSAGKSGRFFRSIGSAFAAGWKCAPVRHFAIGCVVIAIMAILFNEMERRVREMPRFQVQFTSLDLFTEEEFPWIKEDEMRRLLRIPLENGGRSIFDPRLLPDVRRAFLSNPWVGSVEMIQRRYPNTVTFKVRLRRPVAYIKQYSRLYLIDSEGLRLPGVYSKPAPELPLPVVTGIKWSDALPAVGMAYHGTGVREALDLVAILDANRKLLEAYNERVEVIDVGNVGSTLGSEIDFQLSSGTLFEWGRTPGSGNLPVLPTKGKLENLGRALAKKSRLVRQTTFSLWTPYNQHMGSP
ncbi:MAG: cell division protein FtsQ/DivIB [Planctomycetota bacterium]|jgi:hypothetical protein